jgi:23S rRNA (pseudouridine1915-N3)-methyltransferase
LPRPRAGAPPSERDRPGARADNPGAGSMRITIVAIGQRQPRWADEAIADFLKRFPADFSVSVRELKPEPRDGRPPERLRAAESERLRVALPSGSVTVALDERGRDLTSAGLAEQLGRWRDSGEAPAFVIGGPDGLSDEFRRGAQLLLRLSSMTLPHALARLLLVEQLYRAWSILNRHPYHRA